MKLFNKMKEPIFLKENSNAEIQVERLKALKPTLNAKGVSILKKDIKFLEQGIAGEKNIEFELKNSHFPMYVLHDLYLEEGDLSAQIDYLIFTKKVCFVIECKNLYGDITINNSGDFVRLTEFKGRKKKEGIYSPITQNQRHKDLMKKLRVESKNNILTKSISERFFDEFAKLVVVLANPKTVLNDNYASKEVKEKVIRADQLVKYIKEVNKKSSSPTMSEKEMLNWARFYLELHKNSEKDYTKKYESYKVTVNESQSKRGASQVVQDTMRTDNIPAEIKSDLFSELKAFRLNKSREEEIKAYYIFSNKQLNALIEKLPKTKDDLLTIEGFGSTKVDKYGDDIINIINEY